MDGRESRDGGVTTTQITFIVPEPLLSAAARLAWGGLETDIIFPAARWIGPGGALYAVASGVFGTGLLAYLRQVAGDADDFPPLTVHRDFADADPERIVVLCGLRPLAALRSAGLERVAADPADPGAIT